MRYNGWLVVLATSLFASTALGFHMRPPRAAWGVARTRHSSKLSTLPRSRRAAAGPVAVESTDAGLVEVVDETGLPHAAVSDWVVFSDLHVSERSLGTCLEALAMVHDSAARRDAGIIFLGDWWHVRGALPVGALNAVMEALSTWTQPVIMLPGNHDQVCYY